MASWRGTAWLLAGALVGCHGAADVVALRVSEDQEAVFTDFVSFLDDDRVTLEVVRHPDHGLRRRSEAVGLLLDLDCVGCYRVERVGDGLLVHAGDVLGAQYGVASVLEQAGWRFYHPFETLRPASVDLSAVAEDADTVRPEQSIRGLQPHTLHPIEAMYALWEPSDEDLGDAERIMDWLVKNRGNQLQYPALDNILDNSIDRDAWAAHTAALLDYAHARGLRVGVGVQLFGGSNLQQAFDLVEEPGDEAAMRATMDSRLSVLLSPLPWDLVNLSFGEFSGQDPQTFVDGCDLAYDAMQEALPGVEVSTIVHVGNSPDLRVDYQGDTDLLYYFLVKYANPAMVPYVHTVMYYDLYEDAGLAYEHEDFSEHRAFLMDYLSRGEPVAYFPESAYWVAFDDSVPTWLPLYWRSRWTDLHEIAAEAAQDGYSPLDQHVLFSSGWEWGYWQTDVLTLRQGYAGFDDWREGNAWLWAPFGDAGEQMAEATSDLAEVQHDGLIDERLAAWMAGRDQIIDLGDGLGIHSQPDRPDLEEIAAYDADQATAFQASVVDGLSTLASGTRAVLDRMNDVDIDNNWADEARDGAEVDALRAGFAAAITGGALDVGAGGDASAQIEAATAALASARIVVARRHAALHYPHPERILADIDNPTIYDYGYLTRADELCYWSRELALLEQLAGADVSVPGCAF